MNPASSKPLPRTGPSPSSSSSDSPFGLVKVVSWGSLAFILISSLFLSFFLANYAKEAFMAKNQEFSLLLAQNLSHQIIQRFTRPTAMFLGRIDLSKREQYDRLEKIIQATVYGFPVLETRIYDLEKKVKFATNAEILNQADLGGESLNRAMSDRTHSFELISKVDFWHALLGLRPEPRSMVLRTTFPLYDEEMSKLGGSGGPLLGVLEFTQDVSADYQVTVNLQRLIMISSLVYALTLFLILRLILARADRANAARLQERKLLERELVQHEKLASMGRMVAGIAHEIRNPLGIIRSTAELLLKRAKSETDKGGKPDTLRERMLTAIFDESVRLSKTVTDFLDYARPKSPKGHPVDLARVLDQALVFLEPRLAEVGVEVAKDYHEGLIVTGDTDLLYRAFFNVLANATEAIAGQEGKPGHPTDEPGHIVARAETRGEDLCVEIIDSGPGFDQDVKDKLLDPFFTTKETGTGLGLAITASIVESHGGRLSLDNTPEGGAVVRLCFPFKAP